MNSLMDETVKEICTSMLDEPNRWRIETVTMVDTRSGVRYWLNHSFIGEPAITSIWNGYSRDEVFSYEQGKLIYQAYCKMKDHKASVAQQRVIDSIKPKPSFILYEMTPNKKWSATGVGASPVEAYDNWVKDWEKYV